MGAATKFWKPLPLLPLPWLSETATATSATFFKISKPLRATPLLRYRYLVYIFCGTKRAFHPPLANSKNSQKHFSYTWSCLTGEPHLTTPYKSAVLVRWPEGICRRLRSRDGKKYIRCDAMTSENYLYIGSSITDK